MSEKRLLVLRLVFSVVASMVLAVGCAASVEADHTLTGIGAVLSFIEDEELVIIAVIEGGGAHEAGLHEDDAILEIEGEPVTELLYEDAIESIRGPAGTWIELTVRRATTEDIETVDVQRLRIPYP